MAEPRHIHICGKLAKQVLDVCLNAFEHQDVPFEQVVEAIHPTRSLSHSPVFQVSFDMQEAASDGNSMSDLALFVRNGALTIMM